MCDEQGRFWLANGWGVMETELPVFQSAQYRTKGMSAFAERVVKSAEWLVENEGEGCADSLRVAAGRIIAGTY